MRLGSIRIPWRTNLSGTKLACDVERLRSITRLPRGAALGTKSTVEVAPAHSNTVLTFSFSQSFSTLSYGPDARIQPGSFPLNLICHYIPECRVRRKKFGAALLIRSMHIPAMSRMEKGRNHWVGHRRCLQNAQCTQMGPDSQFAASAEADFADPRVNANTSGMAQVTPANEIARK
jgi:hypothetical protein